jgi:phage gp46-like protein
MSDVSFKRRSTDVGFLDMAIVDGDISFGDELESMVMVSLLTDARATAEEYEQASLSLVENPNNVIKLNGWWGDTYSSIQGNQIGSKLWLNARQKTTNDVRILTEQWAEQSLQYLIDDGIASAVGATAGWDKDVMNMNIQITKPDGTLEDFRYQFVWGG